MESTSTNSPFHLEGSNIISNSSGKVVATVENGLVVMMPGCNPMTRKVQDFWAEYGSQNSAENSDSTSAADAAADPVAGDDEEFLPENEFAKDHTADPQISEDPAFADLAGEGNTNVFVGSVPAAGGTSAPAAAADPEEKPDTYADDLMLVNAIPEDELPDLDPVVGTNTKSFKLFVKLYKLTPEQITILVRKLELKLRG